MALLTILLILTAVVFLPPMVLSWYLVKTNKAETIQNPWQNLPTLVLAYGLFMLAIFPLAITYQQITKKIAPVKIADLKVDSRDIDYEITGRIVGEIEPHTEGSVHNWSFNFEDNSGQISVVTHFKPEAEKLVLRGSLEEKSLGREKLFGREKWFSVERSSKGLYLFFLVFGAVLLLAVPALTINLNWRFQLVNFLLSLGSVYILHLLLT